MGYVDDECISLCAAQQVSNNDARTKHSIVFWPKRLGFTIMSGKRNHSIVDVISGQMHISSCSLNILLIRNVAFLYLRFPFIVLNTLYTARFADFSTRKLNPVMNLLVEFKCVGKPIYLDPTHAGLDLGSSGLSLLQTLCSWCFSPQGCAYENLHCYNRRRDKISYRWTLQAIVLDFRWNVYLRTISSSYSKYCTWSVGK